MALFGFWIVRKLLGLRDEARRLFSPGTPWCNITSSWIWDNIRVRGEKVNWHKIVWFPGHVPKFSLISWMVLLNRLPTKVRLGIFVLVTDIVCVLCGSDPESHDHLFIACFFAKEVWRTILASCGVCHDVQNWDDCLSWLVANLKGKSLRVQILKLAWTGFLYFIWKERNHRCFRGHACSVDTVVYRIKEAVKIKLYRFRIHRIDEANRFLFTNWGLI
ncbi:uncharacterized protein LOC120188236 [Hibiscus syriacus]|uniref:uncharacterized protein LOC120188236 n=1 Tax=Hibiscus syriacus TaxID=106335 RepID=UPI0019245C89|nr:uncharacterized protein LOC120188236 [Hibiscus syriacus]